MAEGVAELFVQRVFRYYRLPQKIISDRDPRFTSKFARKLCHLLGIKQNVSTAYHPRMDKQSERTNQWLETYLQFFVNYQQDDWAVHLPLVEFAHNNWKNASTGESPFYLLMGSHPRAEWSSAPSALPQVTQRLEQIREIRAQVQEAMTRAQIMWVKHRNTPQYHKGNLVWLEGHNLRTNQPTAKLAARRHRLFPVEQVLSPVTYKLSLPSTWNIHPVFHTDLLTPYRETPFHGENYQRPLAELVQGQEEYKVEAVLDERHYGRKKKCQYLVKWKGYPDSNNKWVDHADMHAPEAIKEYEEVRKDKSRLRSHINWSNTLMSSSPISISSDSPLTSKFLMPSLQHLPAILPKQGHPSPLPNLAAYPPTVRFPSMWTLAQPRVLMPSEWKQKSAAWREEQVQKIQEEQQRYRQRWVAAVHAAWTSQMRAPVPAEDTTARGCLKRPVHFETPSARCPFCTRLIESCQCNAQSTYRPKILHALKGALEAAHC